MKRNDLTGQTFGKLTVLGYSHTVKPRGTAYFLCRCECGKETAVASGHLKNGHTKSCGCLQVEVVTKRSQGNTWGRHYDNPRTPSAKTVWQCSYADGCSWEKFMELSQQDCFYCGEPPSNNFNKYLTHEGKLTNSAVSQEWADQGNFRYNGLDRVDPTKDHSEDNIVPCCFRCNQAKNNMTISEFVNWVGKVFWHMAK